MRRPLPKERCARRATNLFFMQRSLQRSGSKLQRLRARRARACQRNCVHPRLDAGECRAKARPRDASLWWFRTARRLRSRLYLRAVPLLSLEKRIGLLHSRVRRAPRALDSKLILRRLRQQKLHAAVVLGIYIRDACCVFMRIVLSTDIFVY